MATKLKNPWSKTERLLAERQGRRENNEPAPLEAAYPWPMIPFPAVELGIRAEGLGLGELTGEN